MRVTHLSLSNFRNYGRLELSLPAGATLLYGQNAQGKTNLLEAIYYLATTRSPHAALDNQLLSWESLQADEPVVVGRLVAGIAADHETRLIEMRLISERRPGKTDSFRREALVNQRKTRLMDLLGQLQVVLFLPEDVNLITGAPSRRRRFLDITLCQIDAHYCRALSRYNKVLEQRNAVLRQLAEGSGSKEVLNVYTSQLVDLGTHIFARRAVFFAEIGRDTQRIHYEHLTAGRESLRIGYLPRLLAGQNGSDRQSDPALASWLENRVATPVDIAARFGAELSAALSADIARGATSVGPHRDDWCFWIDNRDLSDYGSRGQQRSALLALKMAEIDWMTKQTGQTPVLLLDEVVAELDASRRALLLHYVRSVEQTILTATDPGMLTTDFLTAATVMHVTGGRVEQASAAGTSLA